jgi:tetratricopeptide (TPR) repeat protein
MGLASTCRDGPELESVRKAETNGLKTFYESIPTKLKLLEMTTAEKGRLAHNIGREWEPEQSEDYPTPGSITMEEYKAYMRERFERDLSRLQQDTLRVVKLLSRAGILPLTHPRIKALLEEEGLFDWRDFHLRRDCLDKLREYAFIGSAPSPEVVRPEPAYLADDVVTYTEGKEPEQDFDVLMHVLRELGDDAGLFYLGNTYYSSLQNMQKAIEAYDAALEIRPEDAEALNNKGNALVAMGDNEGALRAYDAALEIRPDYADALYNKIATLLMQEREEEAIEQLCQAWRNREYLSDRGVSLAQLFEYVGKEPEECQ